MNTSVTENKPTYGTGDASYQAAGGLEGIQKLVNDFYDLMDSLPEFNCIRALHREELGDARIKLCYFLSGWLGGPRLYQQHFGHISIPGFHRKFNIGIVERDAWLNCMEKAIADQDYQADFNEYLLYQLSIPADRCRVPGNNQDPCQ